MIQVVTGDRISSGGLRLFSLSARWGRRRERGTGGAAAICAWLRRAGVGIFWTPATVGCEQPTRRCPEWQNYLRGWWNLSKMAGLRDGEEDCADEQEQCSGEKADESAVAFFRGDNGSPESANEYAEADQMFHDGVRLLLRGSDFVECSCAAGGALEIFA